MDKRIRPHSRRHGRDERRTLAQVRSTIERANDLHAERVMVENRRAERFPGVPPQGTRAEWRAQVKKQQRAS
jgi:hypothetical protein